MELNPDCDYTRTSDLICTKRRRSVALQKRNMLNCKGWSSSKSYQQQGVFVTWWENMDFDSLREIFSRVPVNDLILNVSSVCSSWRTVCWDFLFWSHDVLNLSITGVGFDMTIFSGFASMADAILHSKVCFGDRESVDIYDKMAVELKELLWSVMEGYQVHRQGWTLSIKTIIIPFDLKISDAHLLYISERTPSLERLLLLGTSEITCAGFGKAIQNWIHMKEIHLGRLTDDKYAQFVKLLGEHSQELESLHIHQTNFILEKQSALAIAENLPKLKTLGCYLVQHSYRPHSGSDIFTGRHRWFSLSWVEDGDGFAIWKVKPRRFDPDILFEFDEWMFNRECFPRRQSPNERKIPVWLDQWGYCMEARVDAYSLLKHWAKSGD